MSRDFCRFDGLDHLAKEYRTADNNLDVDQSDSLTVVVFANQLGTFTVAGAVLGVYGIRRLCYAGGFGKHVGGCPRRAAAVCVCLAGVVRTRRAYLVYNLIFAAKELGLLNVTGKPIVKISVFNGFESSGAESRRNNQHRTDDACKDTFHIAYWIV